MYTLAPGLTWANNGSDGGDLITASITGGIAHPTGYPLYLFFARLFQLLPVGSLAFRTNLMSAVMTVLAALLVYVIVIRSSKTSRANQAWPAGLAAGYAFGLAPLIWSQAVITEVYALQALLVLLIIYLYMQPSPVSSSSQKRLDTRRGLLLGLAMGNHLTTLLLVPAALSLGAIRRRDDPGVISKSNFRWLWNWRLDGYSVGRQLMWMGMGLSIYLLLPLRALAHPSINWGNPITPSRFWWLVSGGLYQSYYLHPSLPEIWERLQAGAALLLVQFGLSGVVLGLMGLVIYGFPSRLYFFTIWTALVSIAFAVFYGSVDSYIYLNPLFVSFAVWIGLGTMGMVDQFPQKFLKLGLGLGVLFIVYFAVRSSAQIGQVDASHDLRAERFGREILDTAPDDALIFAKGDQAVFTLWYFHFALKERPDLIVIAEDLLHFDWYQENLRSVYPSLDVPGPFPWPETITSANPLRAVCYVQYIDRTEVDCVEPLMAP